MATGVNRSEDCVDDVAERRSRLRWCNDRSVGPVIVGWRGAGEIESGGGRRLGRIILSGVSGLFAVRGSKIRNQNFIVSLYFN